MQMSKRGSRTEQPPLPFVDENQVERWNRLSLDQQQICAKLLSQLLQQIVMQPGNASEPNERSNHE
jgi:hypothetical protein